uniref:Uncharacterized protein n=1 Tax=Pectobacterium phage Taid TaxID=3158139 RepID=A0AB39AC63_9CAUD
MFPTFPTNALSPVTTRVSAWGNPFPTNRFVGTPKSTRFNQCTIMVQYINF